MAGRIYMGLLHHPMQDKQGKVITTAVTSIDLHDMARLTATFDLAGFFVVQPLELQKKLVRRLVGYWKDGLGGEYNWTRRDAFQRVRLTDDLDQTVAAIIEETGELPLVVGTSAREMEKTVSFAELRSRLGKSACPWLVLFGTGWGVNREFLIERADCIIEPVRGLAGYNHLSVRTAAAIVLDRLLSER